MNKHKFNKNPALIIIGIIAMFLMVTAIVMWLWNALLPEILGVKTINFWHAMGILVLSKILFGGFKGGNGKFRHIREQHFENKMSGMTDEEKEKFKEMWRKRCGTGFFTDEN